MEQKLEKFIEILREKGHKVTPQRIELYKIIKNCKHPTAEEIYQIVNESYPTISPATVYKTIDLLRGIGEVQEISVSDGKIRYETNMTPHINLHCIECGKVEDVFTSPIKDSAKEAIGKSGYEIVCQSFNFFGYCPECQKKKLSEK